MTAFSPPADSWIIHYPKRESPVKDEVKHSSRVPEAKQLEDPCRKYLDSSDIPIKSTRSLGTDDGFKSGILTNLMSCKFLS